MLLDLVQVRHSPVESVCVLAYLCVLSAEVVQGAKRNHGLMLLSFVRVWLVPLGAQEQYVTHTVRALSCTAR